MKTWDIKEDKIRIKIIIKKTEIKANGGIRKIETLSNTRWLDTIAEEINKGRGICGHSLKHSQVEKCLITKIPIEF